MKVLLALALLGCTTASGDPKPATPVGGGPLVLELFTSQGCSSCPAADKVLAELAAHSDRPVAPLSFHVDYWNGLGWADPYSAPQWTARQQQYAAALKDRSVYTPELVVGGAVGMIGSARGQVREAIASAPRVDLLDATAAWSPDAVTVAASAPAGTEVYVALYEGSTTTRVPRGENAGETLVSERVVRRLERVAGQTRVAIDPAWHVAGAVVFAQPRGGGRIVASALLSMAR